jgi:hypothetical protein
VAYAASNGLIVSATTNHSRYRKTGVDFLLVNVTTGEVADTIDDAFE